MLTTARSLPRPALAAIAIAAVAAVVATVAGSLTGLLAAAALAGLAGLTYLGVHTSPALLISLAIAAEVLNGNAGRLGFPIAPDRLLVAAGFLSLLLGLPGSRVSRTVTWRPTQALLAATAAYAGVSALRAGTLTTEAGLFSLLDRLGVVPFLIFVFSPLIFGDRRSRDTLLAVLTALGGYLALTATFEAIGLDALVFPSYILDPSVGIHIERSRGPFTEAVANGLALYGCAVAAAVAWYTWRDRLLARRMAGIVTIACLGSTIFTLTRAVWLATVVATLVALLANHRTRAVLAPTIGVGLAVLAGAILFVPGFADQAGSRSSEQRPLWDRYNSNSAGVRAVLDEPLFGVGWQAWLDVNDRYLELSDEYPLTGTTIEIHNVFLSHAAELGFVGLALWGCAFAAAIGGAILRPGPAELDPWRLGMVAIAIHWLVVASFGPLSYPFPNVLLWTWAGVCSIGHLSQPLRKQT